MRAKLDELRGRARLAGWRRKSIVEQIKEPVPEAKLSQVVTELVHLTASEYTVRTDSLWLYALADEGFDIQTILRIWEAKDKKTLEDRETNL